MADPNSKPGAKPKRGLRMPSLGEIVAILAVVIAGLGSWDSRRDRDEQRAQRQEQAAQTKPRPFLMTGTPDEDGGRIQLTSSRSDQVIQTQTLTFPSEVRGDPVQTNGNPRIERGWFDGGLRRALKDRPGGDAVELEGLALVRRDVTGDMQAAVDAAWPAPAKVEPKAETP